MSIAALAEQYNQFQQAFGQGEDQDYERTINSLFSHDFKKIANGDELTSNRSQLLSQLAGIKEFAGKWTIQSHEIIPSHDNKNCTIRYLLNSEKAGNFEIIAILKVSGGQINQINEIFYKQEK
ncbi:MAG: hypothetical protein K0R76_270 [Alphaproteobacteria bacterium]|jgi:hypothetical protein|nr:hypothetical protein [Alphaproteobacteria bacterium]MDF3033316.1 hypothetical protein [Alphaproteobacteria bacterium]